MKSVSSKSRQQILETASKLFYERGIQNVGINEVIAASGVAKRALYRHFPSKDELILAVMKHRAANGCVGLRKLLPIEEILPKNGYWRHLMYCKNGMPALSFGDVLLSTLCWKSLMPLIQRIKSQLK